MITAILGIPEQHGVPTLEHHAIEHERFIARKQADGQRIQLSVSTDALQAYVDLGRWVADCPDCGAGIAVEPAWGEARCFGCGSIFRNVVVPANYTSIEAVLMERRKVRQRNWHPQKGESLTDLVQENDAQPALMRDDWPVVRSAIAKGGATA